MRRIHASQKGAAAVEFAIVLSLLIVISFGIIEFGLLMFNQQVITNASREGARAGIVARNPRLPGSGIDCGTDCSTPPTIECVVRCYCANNLVTFGTQNEPVTTVTGYSSTASFGNDLAVQVTYQYGFLLIPNFIPGIDRDRPMNALTVMKYE